MARRRKRTKQRNEVPSGNLPIVTIMRVECHAKHWESDLYCPTCKCYHTKAYKCTESEPPITPQGVPASETLAYDYSGTPENWEDRDQRFSKTRRV